VIGAASSMVCFIAATRLKQYFGYDDSLDAFGVHGVGGTVGSLLTGIFAAPFLGGHAAQYPGMLSQFGFQFLACALTLLWSGLLSYVILKGIDMTLGLRVTADEETEGLDATLHGEAGYTV
jgi:ammonium transporter, Amt family